MIGVPRKLAEHALQIILGSKPARQAMRCFGDEKRRAIAKEISKLLKEGFIKEVIHTKWVANPMLVPKKNTKVLHMCVDYTGLNKACPKVPFPLPCIDQVIDSMEGSELLCFLDAYSGYHQIKMKETDQLATLFVTPYGTYCYVTMPFGLKKHRSNVPVHHAKVPGGSNQPQHPCICLRYRCHVQEVGRPYSGFTRDLQQPKEVQHDAQPHEVRLRGTSWTTPRIHRLPPRY
jgi:hypothetical protein